MTDEKRLGATRDRLPWHQRAIVGVIFYVWYWPRIAPRGWWLNFQIWRVQRSNRKLRAEITKLAACLTTLKDKTEATK